MRAIRTLVSILAILLPACRATAVEDDIEGVVRAQEAAWNSGDIEAFMQAGYWQSPDLTFLSGGDWNRDYGTVLERFRKRYASEGKEMGRLSFTDLEPVELSADLGLVRGRWRLEFADGTSSHGLFTLVLRNLPQGWRIIHDHTSVPAPEAADDSEAASS